MRLVVSVVALALLLTACGEVIYTGLDESGRPIEQETSTTTATAESPDVEPGATEDVELSGEVIDTLASLADSIGRLASAGRNLDGELAFIACTSANDDLDSLEAAGVADSPVIGTAVTTAAEIAAECRSSNSIRTYQNLADPAGNAAAELRALVQSLERG